MGCSATSLRGWRRSYDGMAREAPKPWVEVELAPWGDEATMRHNLDYDRPSRLARGVIVLSTVGISMIAAWVFAPILLEKYAAYTGSDTAAPPSREPADDSVAASAAVVMPSAIAAPAPPAAAGTTAVASPAEDTAPTRAVRPSTGSTRPAVPWPIASSPPAPAAADNPTAQPAEPPDRNASRHSAAAAAAGHRKRARGAAHDLRPAGRAHALNRRTRARPWVRPARQAPIPIRTGRYPPSAAATSSACARSRVSTVMSSLVPLAGTSRRLRR